MKARTAGLVGWNISIQSLPISHLNAVGPLSAGDKHTRWFTGAKSRSKEILLRKILDAIAILIGLRACFLRICLGISGTI